MKKVLFFLAAALAALCLNAAARAEGNVPEQLKGARWIWPTGDGLLYDITNSFALFRQKISLGEAPKNARAFITADQSYMLYINGGLVARGPARGFQRSWPFDEVDIAKYLKKGENIFAIRAYNGGRSTFGYISEGIAGVLFAFDIDGKITVSGPKTKSMLQVSCDRDTSPVSVQLNNREHIDMRLEPSGWKNADFDDSQWGKPTRGRNVYNCMPYYTLEARGIPMLEFEMLPPPRLIAAGSGRAGSAAERVRNNWLLFDAEKADCAPVSAGMPVLAKPVKDGDFSVYVLDFGKIVLGTPILSVSGAKGGEIIDAFFDEQIGADFMPAHDFKESSHPAFGFRAICRAGDFEHEFFNYYAFRYAVIKLRNSPSDLKINLAVRWTSYPRESRGVFKTSDELLNKIWQASVYTQRLCTIDAFVDTPWREQAQWWGDARVQAWNTFFISGDTRPLKRGIRIISMQKTPNGLTYGHAPTIAHHCILPDFSLVWIATLWDYYWQTGSNEMFLNHKDTADGIIKYFKSVCDEKTGLPAHDPRYWLFLDWTKIQKNGQPALLSLWYLYALDRLAELCAQTGLDGSEYAREAARMRKAIEDNLLDKSDGLICDGILPDGSRSKLKSIQAQVLARMANIGGFDFERAKKEIILPFLRGEKIPESAPSSYWVVYVLKLMHEEGFDAEVVAFIKKNWAQMAEWGSTFENYAGKGSRSHAWSAHPAFLLPMALGGIVQKEAGWKDFAVSPKTLVDSAEIVCPTPRGDIKISWRKNADGSFEKSVSAPKK